MAVAAMTVPEFPEVPENPCFGTPNVPEFPTPPFRGVGFREGPGTGAHSRTLEAKHEA